ncbi:MAG: hypothetical protein J6L00_02250, partial [Clostridia bacterium]|nr:hypothetical protein [Clostridia bacterium]
MHNIKKRNCTAKAVQFLFANENHAIVAWFKRALAMNRNRRNQRQTQKVFYVMPPSDEGGGFLR